MTEQEIIEGNKLIALFIGAEIVMEELGEAIKLPNGVLFPEPHELNQLNPYLLRYHSSWDWLMPVVEKIESLSVKGREDIGLRDENIKDVEWLFTIDIYNSQCVINRDITPQYMGTEDDFLELYDCRKTSKLQSVWLAVIEFIKWYNQNKQS